MIRVPTSPLLRRGADAARIGRRAGDRSMRAAGRTEWNADDWKASADAAETAMPPFRVSDLIRPGCRIEVGATVRGRPAYRWAQGWQVLNPATGQWSVEVRRADALAMARDVRAEVAA